MSPSFSCFLPPSASGSVSRPSSPSVSSLLQASSAFRARVLSALTDCCCSTERGLGRGGRGAAHDALLSLSLQAEWAGRSAEAAVCLLCRAALSRRLPQLRPELSRRLLDAACLHLRTAALQEAAAQKQEAGQQLRLAERLLQAAAQAEPGNTEARLLRLCRAAEEQQAGGLQAETRRQAEEEAASRSDCSAAVLCLLQAVLQLPTPAAAAFAAPTPPCAASETVSSSGFSATSRFHLRLPCGVQSAPRMQSESGCRSSAPPAAAVAAAALLHLHCPRLAAACLARHGGHEAACWSAVLSPLLQPEAEDEQQQQLQDSQLPAAVLRSPVLAASLWRLRGDVCWQRGEQQRAARCYWSCVALVPLVTVEAATLLRLQATPEALDAEQQSRVQQLVQQLASEEERKQEEEEGEEGSSGAERDCLLLPLSRWALNVAASSSSPSAQMSPCSCTAARPHAASLGCS